MTQLRYAPAREEDIPAIFAQAKAVIDAYEDVEHIPYDRVMDWMRRKIAGHLTEYRRIYRGEELAGYYRFAPAEGKMELDDLYILPACRGQGIGSAVLRDCLAAWSRKSRYSRTCLREMSAPGALYERLGFRTVQEVGATPSDPGAGWRKGGSMSYEDLLTKIYNELPQLKGQLHTPHVVYVKPQGKVYITFQSDVLVEEAAFLKMERVLRQVFSRVSPGPAGGQPLPGSGFPGAY